eukprot:1175883-Prorocentrum_minimum.AAC.2
MDHALSGGRRGVLLLRGCDWSGGGVSSYRVASGEDAAERRVRGRPLAGPAGCVHGDGGRQIGNASRSELMHSEQSNSE